MKLALEYKLSDTNLDVAQTSQQRQLSISISAITESPSGRNVPLNLCLILDHSGSMKGRPLETVKQAACELVQQLSVGDRLSIVAFDHRAKLLLPTKVIDSPEAAGGPGGICEKIKRLEAEGGTAIDEGLKLGIEQMAVGKSGAISQILLLTDGENEHGSNDRCLKLAGVAASYNLTVNTLGFGDHWNQDVLEKIADLGAGTLAYIPRPEAAIAEFSRLFERIQTIGLTNAHLVITPAAHVRLAELKPIAQVLPETIELTAKQEGNQLVVRLGDLMNGNPRIILANLYVAQLPTGEQQIVQLQVRYDDPAHQREGIVSPTVPVYATIQTNYQSQPNSEVQQHVLALAKYRQTQIAEAKLKSGDPTGAATMLQSAAKTALQMGDQEAATVLQKNATQLQAGEALSESQRKQTRMVSKTTLQ